MIEFLKLAAKQQVARTLKKNKWHKAKTAKKLGISRPTLDSWIKKLNLKKPTGQTQ